jgi:hypothetical protein
MLDRLPFEIVAYGVRPFSNSSNGVQQKFFRDTELLGPPGYVNWLLCINDEDP